MATLVRFALLARRHGVLSVRAVATSAVREAANGEEFLREVERTTDLRLEIISGSEEARLIARGVLSSFETSPARVALVDIGGGSTEISLVDGATRFCGSVPLGSVRMTERYCQSDPLLPGHERSMREAIRAALAETVPRAVHGTWPRVVGSAGTLGALANFIRRRPSGPRPGGQPRTAFTTRELSRAASLLKRMPLARRQKAPGIEERRAEIIVAGAIILEEVCAHFDAHSIKVVRCGLRDGLMLDEIERYATSQPGAPLAGQPFRVTRPRCAPP